MRKAFIVYAAFLLLTITQVIHSDELHIMIIDCPDTETVRAEFYKNISGKAVYKKEGKISNSAARIRVSDIKPDTYSIRLFSDSQSAGNKPVSINLSASKKFYISFTKGVLKTGTFRFRITDIEKPEGFIRAALFRLDKGKPQKEPFKTASFPVKGKALVCECADVPYGEYTVSIVHDINGNNKADTREPSLPQIETGKLFAALTPGAGMKYRETVFNLNKNLYSSEVSLKYGFFRTGKLIVRIKGFKDPKGQVLVNLFSQEKGFPTDRKKAFQYKVQKLKAKKAVIEFSNVPFGTYGAGTVHDANSNFKLDTNLFGVPKEGYGASNDAKGRFGPPSFSDASFSVNRDEITIVINMVY